MKFDIYDGNAKARFALGKSSNKKLFVIGLNPSLADAEKSDATITKVERFSKILRLDGFVMLNIYPQRATNPDELDSNPNGNLIEQNLKTIRSQIQNESHPQIWAAWGNLIYSRNYLLDCLNKIANEMKQFNPIWKHCGCLTKLGHPRHPSRLAYKEEFSKFDIFGYLNDNK